MSGDKPKQDAAQQDEVEDAVMSRESATAEYKKLLKHYDIRDKEIVGDEKGAAEQEALRRSFERAGRRIIDSIQDGHVVISYGDECTVTQKMYKDGKSPLTYHEVGARAKKVTDNMKNSASFAQMFAFMAFLAEIDEALIETKIGRDFRLLESLSVVFSVA